MLTAESQQQSAKDPKAGAIAIPGLPSNLRCYETSTAGRIVATNVPIQQGEVVFSCVPHAHTIHHAHKQRTCDTCFLFAEDTILPMPCPRKCGVYFCSKFCSETSRHGCELILSMQQKEGKTKQKKKSKRMHTALSLLIRMVSSSSDTSTKKSTDEIFDDVLLMMQDTSKSAMKKNIIVEDEFRRLLQVSSHSGEPQAKGRYAQALSTAKLNAFGMYDTSGEEIGYALSPAMAMVNHSCLPNCQQITTNGKCQLIALHDIGIGEELTYCYISLLTSVGATDFRNTDATIATAKRNQQTRERMGTIRDQWEFTCLCARCGDSADCRAFDAEHTCYCGAVCLSVDRSTGACVCNPSILTP